MYGSPMFDAFWGEVMHGVPRSVPLEQLADVLRAASVPYGLGGSGGGRGGRGGKGAKKGKSNKAAGNSRAAASKVKAGGSSAAGGDDEGDEEEVLNAADMDAAGIAVSSGAAAEGEAAVVQ